MAVGATVEIETLPGYLPLKVEPQLGAVYRRNAQALVGEASWSEIAAVGASTDAGDLAHVRPVLHPSHGGYTGTNHSADWRLNDPLSAYVTPAKAVAWTLVDLLADDAAQARRVLANFQPQFTGTTTWRTCVAWRGTSGPPTEPRCRESPAVGAGRTRPRETT